MSGPENLKEIWQKIIKPLFVKEKKQTLFGIRYNKMQAILADFGPVEHDRLRFYIAATAEDEPIRDYVDYIKRLESFCDLCVFNPDSKLAAGLDMNKMNAFKTAVDLLGNAMRNADKAYLDRVRNEMPVPKDESMVQRVRSAEITALSQDILKGPGQD